MELFLQQILTGVANGAIYACLALAVVMIYQAIDHFNFAQGEMMMIGAYLGIWGVGLTTFLGSVLALVVFGPISAISKRLVPLGIFLAAGAAVAYAWGEQMIAWYLGFAGIAG